MGSDSPFLDDTIPFSEHARGMKDDELLDIWEQVQRIMIALQDHIIPGVEMKSGVEDAVLVELLRRDTLLRQTHLRHTQRKTHLQHADDAPVARALGTAQAALRVEACQPGPLARDSPPKTKRGVLLRKRRRTAPFFDLFSDTGRNHIRAMSSKSAGLHREAGLRCAVLSPEIPFFHSILFISKKV